MRRVALLTRRRTWSPKPIGNRVRRLIRNEKEPLTRRLSVERSSRFGTLRLLLLLLLVVDAGGVVCRRRRRRLLLLVEAADGERFGRLLDDEIAEDVRQDLRPDDGLRRAGILGAVVAQHRREALVVDAVGVRHRRLSRRRIRRRRRRRRALRRRTLARRRRRRHLSVGLAGPQRLRRHRNRYHLLLRLLLLLLVLLLLVLLLLVLLLLVLLLVLLLLVLLRQDVLDVGRGLKWSPWKRQGQWCLRSCR